MKHKLSETLILFLWVILSVVLFMGFVNITPESDAGETLSEIGIIVSVVLIILIGAVFWYFMTEFQNKHVPVIYSFGMAMLITGIADQIFSLGVLVRFAIIVTTYYLYLSLIKKMKSVGWTMIQPYVQINNAITVLAISFIGISAGKAFMPFVAISIFLLVAIYDAIAVWKLGTMQQMAYALIDERVIPGIAVAKKQFNKFALLGGGDVFFLMFVPASLANHVTMSSAIFTLIGMLGALVYLFFNSSPKKHYPALPFMVLGMVAGFVIELALMFVTITISILGLGVISWIAYKCAEAYLKKEGQ